MRILLVSRYWPHDERSGVSLVARQHLRILLDGLHAVSIVGSSPGVLTEPSSVEKRYLVQSRGSGALYSPNKISIVEVDSVLNGACPDLVIVEAWQTAITDTFLERAAAKGLPVLMISHGVSVSPFLPSMVDCLRAVSWMYYRYIRLPRMINRLSAITSLDLVSDSPRFLDREIARKRHLHLSLLRNSPINTYGKHFRRDERIPQILVVGYYSRVKNQLRAIDLVLMLRSLGCTFLFVGRKEGRYYRRCRRKVERKKLSKMISFKSDEECNLGEEIARSVLVLSVSITEVLPVVLIEAMSSGTPFVSTPVGAVKSLAGGGVARTNDGIASIVKELFTDKEEWGRLSNAGVRQYEQEFSLRNIRTQLFSAMEAAVCVGGTIDEAC